MKEKEQGRDALDAASESKKKPRLLRGCLWFCLVFAFVLIASALYVRSKITEPIDAKNATPVQAVGWLTMRDLSRESAETREELFQMYSGGGAIPEIEPGKSLELPESLKKLASAFLKDRSKRLEELSRTRVRAPYLRLDYVVAPSRVDGRSSRYVLSEDVLPGPSLKARWERSRESSQQRGGGERSIMERNVQLLVMQWFVSRRNLYDGTPDEKKGETLEAFARELAASQGVCNILQGIRGTSMTRVEMLREFELALDGWNEFATVDELAKTLWFKDLTLSVVALKDVAISDKTALYPPLLPARYRAESDSKESAERDFFRRAEPILDAVRNYFFDGDKELIVP